jgi:hypothetical protein
MPPVRSTDRQVRYARVLGLVFIAAGFAGVGIGWSGMARVDCAECQLPYLLSGGAAGLGLILVGGFLIVLAQIRATELSFNESIGRTNAALMRIAGTALAADGKNGHVIAGQSTYHRPDCRLVQGKSNLEKVSVESAQMSGLSPCRVCNPEQVDVPLQA